MNHYWPAVAVAFLAAVVLINAQGNGPVSADFEAFKALHSKTYASAAEEAKAKATFQTTAAQVQAHNADHAAGLVSYTKALNQFADMDDATFSNTRLGYKEVENESSTSAVYQATSQSVPDTFDWSSMGKVSPVLDQGHCGCCWSFTTTGAMESQVLIMNYTLMQFSQQQLVDCETEVPACKGNAPQKAFDFIKKVGGIELSSDYPFVSGPKGPNQGKRGNCTFSSTLAAATVTDSTKVPKDNPSIMSALVNKGPIIISIDAGQGLKHYKSGILQCKKKADRNHSVLLVGYGKDEATGKKYWIVKNSWGTKFGLDGFFHLAISEKKGKPDDCGINQSTMSYPTVSVLSNNDYSSETM